MTMPVMRTYSEESSDTDIHGARIPLLMLQSMESGIRNKPKTCSFALKLRNAIIQAIRSG
jgi:hypothetical protein